MRRPARSSVVGGLLAVLVAGMLGALSPAAQADPGASPELVPFTGSRVITSTWGSPSGGYHPDGSPAIDVSMGVGTPVYAAGSGTVSLASVDNRNCNPNTYPGGVQGCINAGYAGTRVYINHPDGTQSRYLHLSSIVGGIGVGTPVSAGQHIAYSGNTGTSTGPHLHYEERNSNGTARVPGDWVACHGDSRVVYDNMQYRKGQTIRNDGYGCSTAISNGQFVAYAGHVYRIAGGAPIYVSSWTPFGGGQPTRELTAAEWASLRTVPADGTYIAGQSTGRVFVIAGGAPLYVSSWDNVGGAKPVVAVDDAAIGNAGGGSPWNHLNAYPTDVFIRGYTSPAVYRVVNGGHPYWVSSWDPYGGEKPVVLVDHTAIANCDHLNCNPFGSLDVLTGGTGRVRVQGWTMDPNSTSPLEVHVYVGGKYAGRLRADKARSDVDAVYHRGAHYGYDGWVPAPAGTHEVCTYGIDVGVGENDRLACHTTTVGADTAAPTVKVNGAPVFRLGSSVPVSWSGSDAGSGVASYDVRWRRASYSAGFGAWQYPATWQKQARTSVTHNGLVRGYTYCYSVRARDRAGNVSGWAAGPCTSVALDDRSLTGSGWTAGTGAAFYASTYKSTTVLNRVLSRSGAQVSRVAVVARRCPSCGTVGVYVGSTLVGKVNLYAATKSERQVIVLPKFAYRTGTVSLRVLSSGKQVLVDGIGISRA